MNTDLPRLLVYPAPFLTLEEALEIDPVTAAGSASLKPVSGPRATRSTTFCCFGDGHSLFVIFSVADAFEHPTPIRPTEAVRTPGLWELSEVVEVFIGADARETGRYREFEVAPDGRWIAIDVRTDASGMTGNQEWTTGFRCAVARHAGNLWKAALEIPWRDLGGRRLVWHGNFYRSIPGDIELYAWSPTGSGPHCFHRPERFGELMIVPPNDSA
jgi:hypothetical protein